MTKKEQAEREAELAALENNLISPRQRSSNEHNPPPPLLVKNSTNEKSDSLSSKSSKQDDDEDNTDGTGSMIIKREDEEVDFNSSMIVRDDDNDKTEDSSDFNSSMIIRNDDDDKKEEESDFNSSMIVKADDLKDVSKKAEEKGGSDWSSTMCFKGDEEDDDSDDEVVALPRRNISSGSRIKTEENKKYAEMLRPMIEKVIETVAAQVNNCSVETFLVASAHTSHDDRRSLRFKRICWCSLRTRPRS